MAVVGSVFAIGVAKQVFGGLGMNPFNPALAARLTREAMRLLDAAIRERPGDWYWFNKRWILEAV